MPSRKLLTARVSGDLKQLKNRDFSSSNRSKPICVLTRTQSSCSDDRLPIGYLLPDFQPIWRNFFDSLFHNQVWRGSTLPPGMDIIPNSGVKILIKFPFVSTPFQLYCEKVNQKSFFKSAENRGASSLWVGHHRYARVLQMSKLLLV